MFRRISLNLANWHCETKRQNEQQAKVETGGESAADVEAQQAKNCYTASRRVGAVM
jgi:hypothetical protein